MTDKSLPFKIEQICKNGCYHINWILNTSCLPTAFQQIYIFLVLEIFNAMCQSEFYFVAYFFFLWHSFPIQIPNSLPNMKYDASNFCLYCTGKWAVDLFLWNFEIVALHRSGILLA